jgi:hypothetical protein
LHIVLAVVPRLNCLAEESVLFNRSGRTPSKAVNFILSRGPQTPP